MTRILFVDSAYNRAKMLQVADYLRGSSRTLDSALVRVFGPAGTDIDAYAAPLFELLDRQVMQCDECGGWHVPEELTDDQLCSDCALHETEDEA